MTVRAGVEQNTWSQPDIAVTARSVAAQAKNFLPFVGVFLIIVLTVLFAISCGGSTVSFRSNSAVTTLNVEVASTPEELARGLMERESLAADSGMLFDFGKDVTQSFWMKDTSIPLSVAFIDSGGKVIGIKDMEPFDETPVEPPGTYRYAVEANRGWFASHGIETGTTALVDL